MQSPEQTILKDLPKDTLDNDKEQKEKMDAVFEIILKVSKYLDSGNNGIIHSFFIEDISSTMLYEKIKQEEDSCELKESYAIKLLKIYSKGEGKSEFLMQKKAYELVSSDGDGSFAQIPQPLLYETVQINDALLKKTLEEEGIENPENIDIIVMDLVEGDDFAKYLYKKVIELANPNTPDLENMQMDELQSRVAHILDFHISKNKLDPEANNRIFRDNAKKIIPFLKRKNHGKKPILNPIVMEKLQKTISLLHKAGIYHRDLHERNVMLKENGNDVNVSIIDFGSAIKSQGSNDIYEQEGVRFVDDKMILHIYRDLTLSSNDEELQKINLLKQDILRIKKRIEKRGYWEPFIEQLQKTPNNPELILKEVDRFALQIAFDTNSDLFWKVKILALQEVSKENPEISALALKRARRQNLIPFVSNLINDLERLL